MYVKCTSNGSYHKVQPGTGKTVCGINYRQYDYIPRNEDELDTTHYPICHRCNGTKREHPRMTIREAFTRGRIE